MRKVASILLLALFLFNICGYQVWFYVEQRADDLRMEASLDRNAYNPRDLVTIKIPLSLPYLNSQQHFERVSGEIQFQGNIYRFVKRKVHDDTLILLCLADRSKRLIQTARDEFFRLANDLQQNSTSKKSEKGNPAPKNFNPDFECTGYTSAQPDLLTARLFSRMSLDFILKSPGYPSPEQPPDPNWM